MNKISDANFFLKKTKINSKKYFLKISNNDISLKFFKKISKNSKKIPNFIV